jgi:hypothetical protein
MINLVLSDIYLADLREDILLNKYKIYDFLGNDIEKAFWFGFVILDVWYSSNENMNCCKKELNNDFIMALKSNRKVALSLENKQNKEYISIETLQLGQQTVEVWFELDFRCCLQSKFSKTRMIQSASCTWPVVI